MTNNKYHNGRTRLKYDRQTAETDTKQTADFSGLVQAPKLNVADLTRSYLNRKTDLHKFDTLLLNPIERFKFLYI